MLRSLDEIKGYELKAKDGELGRCKDFLIDDQAWAVRYMVADTSKWLPGRQVLISPIALGEPEWAEHRLPVKLTKEQIEAAPELDEHAPVTREYEIWYYRHYGWPNYWVGTELWGHGVHPEALPVPPEQKSEDGEMSPKEDEFDHPHLHSAEEVIGYDISAADGEIGRVDDFILDDENWSVRYLVAATRKWLPGKRVLIPLTRLQNIAWENRALEVDLTVV